MAIVGVLVFGAADATAHNKLWKSRVKVSFHVNAIDFVEIHGVVKSKEPKCRKGRTVKVFAIAPGKDPKVGTTNTNKKGEWWLHSSLAVVSTRYKAKIGSVKRFGRQKNHGCTTDVGREGVT